ncbi:hypothetical protein E1286_44175 [Nonomuraea terrae]|uniref:Uncharacterized protein n=1 Tax=Nonomuraea terrae TaxID=2530383 RepID=A0A4R4XMD9_9ACTN|nr:hypothetical protein [Nonomuraea terrae]TDD31989.1 hypothetical protein E1286_44175 [Nonomuraea terrae]
MWEDAPFREMIERRMREQLLAKVVEEGCVPVTLPTAAYRHFAEPAYFLTSGAVRWLSGVVSLFLQVKER